MGGAEVMDRFDGSQINDPPLGPSTTIGRHPDFPPVSPPPRAPTNTRTSLALRLAALLALTLLGFGGAFYDVARSIGGGSRAAYLLVMPVLLVMIA